MKIPQPSIRTFLLILILISNSAFASDLVFKTDSSKSRMITFKLKLKSDEKVKIQPSALKFNKHLAYSFTVDDGYRSAY